MEQLAWQLLESKKDIIAAEKVFAALANRAKLRSTSNSISEKDFESIQTHKMITVVVTLFFSSSASSPSSSPSSASNINNNNNLSSHPTVSLTTDQCRSLAAAVLEPRIPSFVLFGCPRNEDELAKAYRTIQLFVHPDKGHVKTTEAFVKLSERKFECVEQLKEFQEYRAEEDRKEQEKREEVMKQFAEAVKRSEESAFHSNHVMFPTSPFSSIPTGQNMFTLHQQQQQQQQQQLRRGVTSPIHNNTNKNQNFNNNNENKSGAGSFSPTSTSSIGLLNTETAHHHQSNNNCHNSNDILDTTATSGSYHLPPLQGRKKVQNTLNENHSSPNRQNNNSSSPVNIINNNSNNNSTSSSFAVPTSKPNPLDRSGRGRPPSANSSPSAAMNASMSSSSSSKKFLDFASSPRRAGVATFSPHEKNKQKMKEKEFDSLMKQLRQQKHQTGANMNGTFNKFLGELQHDHIEQRKEEELTSRKNQLKSKQRNNENNNNNNKTQNKDDEKCDSEKNNHTKDSDSMIELTMKALLSKLKTQNSNVKLTCSLTSSHSHSENAQNDVSGNESKQQDHEDEGNEEHRNGNSSTPKKSCRDFVVQRLGQVLQGHLRSFGDEIIDFSNDNNNSKSNNSLEDLLNLDHRRRHSNDQQKEEDENDEAPKDFQIFGSKFIASPPSARRQSLSKNGTVNNVDTPGNVNHQGVSVSQQYSDKKSGIHAAFHVTSPSTNANSAPRRFSLSTKR